VAGAREFKERRVLDKTSANYRGQFGESDAPDHCTECGAWWTSSERLHTGDSKGIGGWEDWMYCIACGCDMFFPVTRYEQKPNARANARP
jgi:hypothetical protein